MVASAQEGEPIFLKSVDGPWWVGPAAVGGLTEARELYKLDCSLSIALLTSAAKQPPLLGRPGSQQPKGVEGQVAELEMRRQRD